MVPYRKCAKGTKAPKHPKLFIALACIVLPFCLMCLTYGIFDTAWRIAKRKAIKNVKLIRVFCVLFEPHLPQ